MGLLQIADNHEAAETKFLNFQAMTSAYILFPDFLRKGKHQLNTKGHEGMGKYIDSFSNNHISKHTLLKITTEDSSYHHDKV